MALQSVAQQSEQRRPINYNDSRKMEISDAAMLALSISELASDGVSNDGLATHEIHLIQHAARAVYAILEEVQRDADETRVTA